jgi:hypothetical protein
MTAQTTEAKGGKEFVKQSNLYQEFLAEREEILKHKWLESERLGYDIGFERALLDWIRKHRDTWRASRRAQLATTSPVANRAGAPAQSSTGGSAQAGDPAAKL